MCKRHKVRNKAKLAIALIQNQIQFGFYTNQMQFKQLEDCPLHAPAINALLIELKTQLNHYKITPYDLVTKKGELKYVLITYSESTNELLLRLVLRSTALTTQIKKVTKICLHQIQQSKLLQQTSSQSIKLF